MLVHAGCATGSAASARTPAGSAAPGPWTLVWSDEFDGHVLNSYKWRAEDAALVKNNEMQYYTPSDVYVHDGVLTLRSQRRRMGGRPYTSGAVDTRRHFAWRYGRFEIRAKLPRGRGLWPAHWLLPVDNVWPPEIDIIELLGHDPHTVLMTNHWGRAATHAWKGETWTGPDFTDDFHVFALEWEPEQLRWYVDGTLRYATKYHVPRRRMYLILNTAVGGDLPGAPDATTVFPQYHDIDYVRIYKRSASR